MSTFAQDLIAWQKSCGRHHLPWQGTTDPYRIWVSEIMLQQTQVSTVVERYTAFLARFPDVRRLADATLEEVLGLWSGLGYYSRARNLHATARLIMTQYQGRFPATASALQELPGIGRSTAAAVACFAGSDAQPILDGNVRRVLARVFAIEGWPGRVEVERRLWQIAEDQLPRTSGHEALRAYTQGLMDLGATVCTPREPRCEACPVAGQCQALASRRVAELPTPRPARMVEQRRADWAMIIDGRRVLLQVRPARGVWGGLWSLPEIRSPLAQHACDEIDVRAVQAWAASHPGLGRMTGVAHATDLLAEPLVAPVRHTFTHFRLEARVWRIDAGTGSAGLRHDAPDPQALSGSDPVQMRWLALDPDSMAGAPLPTPVRKLLYALI